MRTSGRTTICGIAVVLAGVLAACSTGGSTSSPSSTSPSSASSGQASSRPASSPASIGTLKQQAGKETGLVIYANAPTQYFQPVIAAFNKVYPQIHVSVTTLSDNTVFSKYEAEAAQGARTADLLVASAPASWVQAEQNGVAANVTPAGLSSFPSWVSQGHGVYVMSAEPILLGYSPKLLTPAQVPATWAQLAADAKANPARYKMVSYPVTNPLDYAGIYGLIHILGAGKVWSYYDALAPVTKTYDEGLTQLSVILQGGASIGYMTSGLAQGVLPHFKGLAAYKFMQDATPLVPRGIAVTAKAASPASAQLFLDFLYSQSGQNALCAGGFEATMNNFHGSSACTASLTALQTQVPPNTTYLVPISQVVLGQQSAITQRWDQAFHR
jgi:iron(III) transport system substrate-binding protein